jgi:hypothetical protein
MPVAMPDLGCARIESQAADQSHALIGNAASTPALMQSVDTFLTGLRAA